MEIGPGELPGLLFLRGGNGKEKEEERNRELVATQDCGMNVGHRCIGREAPGG